jgi:hypothetical protein
MAQKNHDRIREEAYFLWQNDGCQDGREMDYWLAAEDKVLGNKKKTTASKKPAVAAVKSTKKTTAKKTASKKK